MDALENDNINQRLLTVEKICNKMESQITKIFEVVVGDENFGQVGLIKRLVKLEEEVVRINGFKNKMIGASVVGGGVFTIFLEIIKAYIK